MTTLSDNEYLFTSESVTEGHPDKIADQISDGVLDAVLRDDPTGRVACETLVNTGLVVVSGEITTDTYVDIQEIARETVKKIGYTNAEMGFDCHTCAVINAIDKQSPDIAKGVDSAQENSENPEDAYNQIGAGDQGLVFGFAIRENKDYLPTPIYLAHRLAKRLEYVRKTDVLVPGAEISGSSLYPDGKTQVTIKYDDAGVPIAIDTIVVSSQHAANVTLEQIQHYIRKAVIEHVVDEYNAEQRSNGFPELENVGKYFINPTGRFVAGGPGADAGLTGRKIIVDTYGGFGRHGGGAFSGKDYTKVDRSAAYAARWVAKNIVASKLAKKVEIQVAYAIGVARPVSIYVDTFGTGLLPDEKLQEIVESIFDLRPAAIIDILKLKTAPTYALTSTYGHFGRNPDEGFTWERLDKVNELREAYSKSGFGFFI
jgi:S-adenosylmethionine synthetase